MVFVNSCRVHFLKVHVLIIQAVGWPKQKGVQNATQSEEIFNSIRKQSRPGFSVIQNQIDHLTMFLMGTWQEEN